MVCKKFWVEFFGSLSYRIILSANKDILTVSLPICITFIPSSCLNALAQNSSTMLKRSQDSEHPCLIPDFRGNGFSFSPLIMMLAVNLSYITFTMLNYIPSIPSFLRAFIMKWCWILSKALSTSMEITKWFIFLLLLMCCITFIDLHMLNHACIPELKPTWSLCLIFLMCC
jgi:hypothetical protein